MSPDGRAPASPMLAPASCRNSYSYLAPIGYFKSSKCGYCGRDGKSFSYYAAAVSMSPAFYKKLLDRYWRRSGALLYRPDQRRACCPHYSIRLDSTEFRPTKDQRQAVNRFNRHVLGDDYAAASARLHPRSRADIRRRDNVFDLPARIHEAEHARVPHPPEPAHQLAVTLEDDSFTEEKFQVFANYQRVVHHEDDHDISRSGFKRFLCDSPIARQTVAAGPDDSEIRYGSFHQCYRLDGRLVAVGVLDLLPGCVSAVYLFYHESIHAFSPGKLSALREIALAAEGGYRYWYPGFYIHSCPKMRYKLDYAPQYMLDPESLEWDLCDGKLLDLLSAQPYVSLSRERARSTSAAAASKAAAAVLPAPDGISSPATPSDPSDTPSDPSGPPTPGNNPAAHDSNDAADDGSAGPSTMFLFDAAMPGVATLADVAKVDLDSIGVRVPGPWPDGFYSTADLSAWADQAIDDYGCFKASVAELVAAVGVDLIGSIRLARRPSS
jgi:arginine-tRNA-protein transferase